MIYLYILIGAMIASALRAVIGPSIWDRLLGVNLVNTKLVMLIVLLALVQDQEMFLDIALVFGLLGFIGTVFFAISLERKRTE